MKIQIASDLHLEVLEKKFPDYRIIDHTDADVLVIAGDIHRNTRAIEVFADWPVPVIYVHGNHEAYNGNYLKFIDMMRALSAGSNVHFLERNRYILNGIRFLGCCLWTDYQLGIENPLIAMQEAEKTMNDHRLIQFQERVFSAHDALQIHQKSREWLETQLNEHFEGRTVVITHHGPHPNSIHPQYAKESLLNAAFISDLSPLMGKAHLWVHGHVHDSFDYTVCGTRVIANPRGYARNRSSAASPNQLLWENTSFNPALVVDIS